MPASRMQKREAMTQGYITLATGSRAYYDMAENFAASIRVMDPGRPLAVVIDDEAMITPLARKLFDYVIVLPTDPDYEGVINKFRLFELSPFDHTMFVDADCLMVKRDIGDYWDIGATRPFMISGRRITSGIWKGRDVATLMRDEGVSHIVEVPAGIFCFDKSEQARGLFEGIRRFYLERRHALTYDTHGGKRLYSDELFFSVYMAKYGIEPWARDDTQLNSWMVTTTRSLVLHANPLRGEALMLKFTGRMFGIPILPSRLTRISPTFLHFVGLKPAGVYARLATGFRAEALALLDHSKAAREPAGVPA